MTQRLQQIVRHIGCRIDAQRQNHEGSVRHQQRGAADADAFRQQVQQHEHRHEGRHRPEQGGQAGSGFTGNPASQTNDRQQTAAQQTQQKGAAPDPKIGDEARQKVDDEAVGNEAHDTTPFRSSNRSTWPASITTSEIIPR